MSKPRFIASVGVALGLAIGAPKIARADETTNGVGPAFSSWGAEFAVGTVSIGTLVTGFLLPQNTERNLAPDASHPADETSNVASYITAGVSIGLGVAMYVTEGAMRVHDTDAAYARALLPALVELEAAALAEGTTEILKKAIGRCRPRAWNASLEECDATSPDDFAAFPSGHTALPSALAGARLVFALRSKGHALTAARWVNFGLTEVLSLATGGLRVTAGAHSITDVLGGWAIGHAAGIGVALLHPFETRYGTVSLGPGSIGWVGAF